MIKIDLQKYNFINPFHLQDLNIVDFLPDKTESVCKQHEYNLTKWQFECLFYLAKGMTAKQIAGQLAISSRTVEYYLQEIKIKLNCASRSELISAALKIKWIRDNI